MGNAINSKKPDDGILLAELCEFFEPYGIVKNLVLTIYKKLPGRISDSAKSP